MELEPIWEDRETMPDFEKKYWDEDDWERFMTIQDKKVDELMRLDELFLNSVSYTHLTPVSYTHLTLPTTPYV